MDFFSSGAILFYVIFPLIFLLLLLLYNAADLQGLPGIIALVLIIITALFLVVMSTLHSRYTKNEQREEVLTLRRERADSVQEEFTTLSLKMIETKEAAAIYCEDEAAHTKDIIPLAGEFSTASYIIEGPVFRAKNIYPEPIVNSMNNFLSELGAKDRGFVMFCSEAKIDRAALLKRLSLLNKDMSTFVDKEFVSDHKQGNLRYYFWFAVSFMLFVMSVFVVLLILDDKRKSKFSDKMRATCDELQTACDELQIACAAAREFIDLAVKNANEMKNSDKGEENVDDNNKTNHNK